MEIIAFGTMFLYFALKIIGFFVGWKMTQDAMNTFEQSWPEAASIKGASKDGKQQNR